LYRTDVLFSNEVTLLKQLDFTVQRCCVYVVLLTFAVHDMITQFRDRGVETYSV